jgi:hypothetical protein
MAHIKQAAAKPKFWAWLTLPLRLGLPIQVTAVLLIAVLAVFLYQKERQVEQAEPAAGTGRSADSIIQESRSPQTAPTNAPLTDKSTRNPHSDETQKLAQQTQQQQLQQSPGQAAGTTRPFGAPGPGVGTSSEYGRVGGEMTVDYRVVIRLQAPAREEAERLRSQPARFSSLSVEQTKRLRQVRLRAIQSGQAQNELFSIPHNNYEQLKKELASIGNFESDSPPDSRQTDSAAKKNSDPVLILLTLLPPIAPANVVPAEPEAR